MKLAQKALLDTISRSHEFEYGVLKSIIDVKG